MKLTPADLGPPTSIEESEELKFLKNGKVQQVVGEKRASYFWRLLRFCINDAVKYVEKADAKDKVISHGICQVRRINHAHPIHSVTKNTRDELLVTVDSQRKIHTFSTKNGRQIDEVQPEDPIEEILYCEDTNQYVGWIRNDDHLALMSRDFEILSAGKGPSSICCVQYNKHKAEVVTGCIGAISSWSFRFNARYLMPRRTCREGLSADHSYSLLCLEDTASDKQRCFIAVGRSVLVMNLRSATIIDRRQDMHARPISALLYFNPRKQLVTGSQDGAIKVWTDDWLIQMVFVGHVGMVSCLAPYTQGSALVSTSLDQTMRVWSLETLDEEAQYDLDDDVLTLSIQAGQTNFYTRASTYLTMWIVRDLYTVHTSIGAEVSDLQQIRHPHYPPRAMLTCKDAAVRLVVPATGDVLQTTLCKRGTSILDSAYSAGENTLFLAYGDGAVEKFRTDVNPSESVAYWQHEVYKDDVVWKETCTVLLVYEYVVDVMLKHDTWGAFRRAIATKTFATEPEDESEEDDHSPAKTACTLLFGGRRDGFIVKLDWNTGKVLFKMEAHGSKGVMSMVANSAEDQLISAGLDNVIKIWRLYPFADEALAPLMSFFCAHSPIYMTMMGSKIAVNFQDHPSCTYSVVVYDLEEKERRDHEPDDDHSDTIVGLDSCKKLRLFVSASIDGTVRLWNEYNQLVRVIKLHARPLSVAFCSDQGDILVGIGKHLHIIRSSQYMPMGYKHRMLCMRFRKPLDEEPVPQNPDLSTLSLDDKNRLKGPKAVSRFESYDDILSKEEEEQVFEEKRKLQKELEKVQQREAEIREMIIGTRKAERLSAPTQETQAEAFQKYLQIFYDRPKLEIPYDDPFFTDTVKEKTEKPPPPPPKDEWRPEPEPSAFFPPPSTAKKSRRSRRRERTWVTVTTDHGESVQKEEETEVTVEEALPIQAGGFVPNSVLAHLLWPPPSPPTPDEDILAYTPPKLTDEQLAEIAAHKKPYEVPILQQQLTKEGTEETEKFDDRTILVEYSSDEELKEPTPRTPSPVIEQPVLTPRTPKKKKKEKSKISFADDDSETEAEKQDRLQREEEAARLEAERNKSSFMKSLEEEMERPVTPRSPTPEPDGTKLGISDKSKGKRKETMRTLPRRTTAEPSVFDLLDIPEAPSFERDGTGTATIESLPRSIDSIAHPTPVPYTPDTRTATPVQPSPPPQKTPTPRRTPQRPLKPIKKIIAKAEIRIPSPLPRSPTPPPTPLPDFILNFIGLPWFEEHFPNTNTNTLPKPWTVDAFVAMILRVMKLSTTSYQVKCEILKSITNLHLQEGISNIEVVLQSVLGVLNKALNPPSSSEPDEAEFISCCIQLFSSVGLQTNDIVTEAMAQFIDGDQDLKRQCIELLKQLGLNDPHMYIQKELDSWDTWQLDEEDHKRDLKKMCQEFVDKCLSKFRSHIQDTIDRLERGETLQSRLGARGQQNKAGKKAKGIIKKDEEEPKRVTVTFEGAPTQEQVQNATPIEALNYFAEMKWEKQIAFMRGGRGTTGSRGTSDGPPKNTVLVLPKVERKPCLVRLGESHYQRKASDNHRIRLPPIQQPRSFLNLAPSSIILPLKSVNLNPFPCALDELDRPETEPLLLTLKLNQKYFHLDRSVVPDTVVR